MKLKTSLSKQNLMPVMAKLKRANAAVAKLYPGDPSIRQPVHTVYGGAHLFKASTVAKLGELALNSLHTYAPDPETLSELLGWSDGGNHADLSRKVYARVADKLRREAVEDFRIDFEDGFGHRSDSEEDSTAVRAAEETAAALAEGSLSPFIGIRIKPLSGELFARSVRTLDLYLTTLLNRTKRRMPGNFVVTLPKITTPEQPAALAKLLGLIEKKHRLAKGALKLELMIETTQSILLPDGTAALRRLVEASDGRCLAAHFGTYDYTALCSVTAEYQEMTHPCCDFAKHVMQVALAGSGLTLSDGATNIMPVGPHKAPAGGGLDPDKRLENREAVHSAWKIHYDHVRHSLKHAYYQGWDLHPAQLPTRYAAVYSFFLEGFDAASARLKNFVEKAAQATLVGDVFDDAATGQGLLNYFLRALNCGAITEKEAAATGLTLEEIRGRSFAKIMEGRRAASKT